MATFDSIGQLDEHPNQLIVAELGPVLVFNQLGQVTILTVFSEQVQLVVNFPVVVQPKKVSISTFGRKMSTYSRICFDRP